jgi:hypothetical protein
MESGGFLTVMSSILEQRGISPEEVQWEDLALCRGLPTSFFFETYEQDKTSAKFVDEMCLRCPVMKQCAMSAKETNAFGVWGGIYWHSGTYDKYRNAHKTPKVMNRIRERLS